MNAPKLKIAGCAIALTMFSAIAPHADAQPRERHDRWNGDIRHFHERDFDRWRGGRWFRGNYLGHYGWWWIVGGVYYWYPRPVYPYPDPYIPPAVITQAPPIVAQPPAVAPPAASQAPQAGTGVWYYCDSAQAYYPYVSQCPSGWRAVPTTPTSPSAR